MALTIEPNVEEVLPPPRRRSFLLSDLSEGQRYTAGLAGALVVALLAFGVPRGEREVVAQSPGPSAAAEEAGLFARGPGSPIDATVTRVAPASTGSPTTNLDTADVPPVPSTELSPTTPDTTAEPLTAPPPEPSAPPAEPAPAPAPTPGPAEPAPAPPAPLPVPLPLPVG